MTKITNIDELRAEIARLKRQRKQQELSLKERADALTDKFQPIINILDFLGIVDSGEQQDQGKTKSSIGGIALRKGLEYGLPYLMNRLFFRSNVKAGISSILGIVLGESARKYLNEDSSRLVDPVVNFIRNIVDNTKTAKQNRKEKRSFAKRYDNLEQDIYS